MVLVGGRYSFEANADGQELLLGINDDTVADNSGAWTVRIMLQPPGFASVPAAAAVGAALTKEDRLISVRLFGTNPMLFEPVFAHAAHRPQDVAIVDDRGQTTYQQLAAMSAGLGMYLSAQTQRPRVVTNWAATRSCSFGNSRSLALFKTARGSRVKGRSPAIGTVDE